MRYQHVLVPVDLTKPDPVAIQAAYDLARQYHARMTLLHVIESIDELTDDSEMDKFYAAVEERVRENVALVTQQFKSSELVVQQDVVVGRRARDIVRYSATHAVDLIVMRSDRVNPDQPRAAISKISHQVSMFSQCPVMLVK